MQYLIETVVTNDGPRVDSRQFLPHLDVRHRDTFSLINTYSDQLRELGIIPYLIQWDASTDTENPVCFTTGAGTRSPRST